MSDLFIILALASFALLIAGIVNPNISLFWSKKKTRPRSLAVYGAAIIIFFVGFGIFADAEALTDKGTSESEAPNNLVDSAPVNAPEYKLIKRDDDRDGAEYRIWIPSKYSKKELLAISAQLRGDRKDKGVMFFHTKKQASGAAYASVTYLPKCQDCGNDIDAAGNKADVWVIDGEE